MSCSIPDEKTYPAHPVTECRSAFRSAGSTADHLYTVYQKRGAERIAMLEKAAAGKADPDSPEYTHATSGRYVGVTILVDFPILDASGNVADIVGTAVNMTQAQAQNGGTGQ